MEFGQTAIFPSQGSTTAAHVDHLLYFLLVICGAAGLLVAFLLIFFSIHYRRRPGDGRPPKTNSSRALEWFWTLTPLPIFAVMYVWGAIVYIDAYRPPDDAIRVYGVGKQWMWKFQHPEGQREINTLHLPAGRSIQIVLVSEDVIHSFFVPVFRVHMDVLPGRYTSLWVQPTQPGEYHLFCSQYCGTNHSGMVGTAIVMDPADYARWLAEHAEGSLALEGRKVFLKYRCLSCHSADANARAPVLEKLFGSRVRLTSGQVVTADQNYIRESILNPSAQIVEGWRDIMPTFRGQIREDELYALNAYIESLGGNQTPPRVESYPPPLTTPAINTTTDKP